MSAEYDRKFRLARTIMFDPTYHFLSQRPLMALDAPKFGEQARTWHVQGARLIGGCCRTRPYDIRGIKQCVYSEPSAQ
jgi:S-methylmethionine-dependent homocysteine/selenocysteine methylase